MLLVPQEVIEQTFILGKKVLWRWHSTFPPETSGPCPALMDLESFGKLCLSSTDLCCLCTNLIMIAGLYRFTWREDGFLQYHQTSHLLLCRNKIQLSQLTITVLTAPVICFLGHSGDPRLSQLMWCGSRLCEYPLQSNSSFLLNYSTIFYSFCSKL